MPLRSARERFYQTISFELGGLLLAAPLCALVFGKSAQASLALVLAISVAAMAWSPLHNTVFDWLDLRLTGRTASERPHGLRLVHAASNEVTSTFVTVPVIMWIAGLAFWQALALDVTLTLFYGAYAYVFHLGYDRMRPMSSVVRPVPF